MANPKRSQRLQIVLQLAQQKEEAAQQELLQAQTRLQQEQDKLVQLQQYQSEYLDNLKAQTGRQMSAMQYQAMTQFINRLSVAISEQRRQVQLVGIALERVQAKWRQLYQKRQKMGDFIERCKKDEAREQDQREQRLMDEASQRIAARRN